MPAAERGSTLIELLVAMAMAVVVFGATLTAIDFFQNHNRVDILRNEAQDYARSAVDRLTREIRNVAAPKVEVELPGALEQAEEYSLVFQTIDASPKPVGSLNASNAMRVRYCLNNATPKNEILWRQAKRWTSATAPEAPAANSPCPDPSASHWDSSSQLAQHLTNRDGAPQRPLFKYGPAGWSTVSQIVTVEPSLFLDVAPGTRPGETQLSSAISLRNANRPPVAAFTVKEVNGHAQLNASESVDPDGLALTYKWWEGATLQAATAQSWETAALTAGSHGFTLEVTDPGGLSNATTKTVTIK